MDAWSHVLQSIDLAHCKPRQASQRRVCMRALSKPVSDKALPNGRRPKRWRGSHHACKSLPPAQRDNVAVKGAALMWEDGTVVALVC